MVFTKTKMIEALCDVLEEIQRHFTETKTAPLILAEIDHHIIEASEAKELPSETELLRILKDILEESLDTLKRTSDYPRLQGRIEATLKMLEIYERDTNERKK